MAKENVSKKCNRGFSIYVPDVMMTNSCNFRCKYCFENKGDKNLSYNKMLEYFNKKLFVSPFIFGGEPLLRLNELDKLIKHLNIDGMGEKKVANMMNGFKRIITNGSLIRHNIKKLKDMQAVLQISIDGPKDIHNKNRVFITGKGTFDYTMDGINACIENDMECSIHGAVNKDTLKDVFQMFLFFFETELKIKKGNLDAVIQSLGQNTFQIIFEEDYTDKNIDEVVGEFFKIADWIYYNDILNNEQKKNMFKSWFGKGGGICGAGNSLMAIDCELNIYPCHRLCTDINKNRYNLGNVYYPDNFNNYEIYNSLYKVGMRHQKLYSSGILIDKNIPTWFNWCPATNIQTSNDNPYYINSKYAIAMLEIGKAIDAIWKHYYPEEVMKKDGNIRK